MPRKTTKAKVQKGVTDVGMIGDASGIASAFTVQALRAIDNALDPRDAYNLSVDLRSAIHARNEPVSMGRPRLFYRKSGDEITAGPIVDFLSHPCPVLNQRGFLYELGAWWDLAGEMAVGSIFDASDTTGTNSVPAGIYTLNPFRLVVQQPLPPKHLASVDQWRYHWDNGIQVVYGAESVVLMKNFNPTSLVRGSPPVLAGGNDISAGFEAMAYNRRFFSNNCEPSHLVIMPNVTDPKMVEAFKNEYIANHSIRKGNSHKVMFVAGSDVRIEPVGQLPKEASFVNLQNLTSERIMRLYKVPPVHGGLWDKAKFDSVEEQNKVFAETVLMPQAERVSEFLQMVIDRWFRSKAGNLRAPEGQRQLTRRMQATLDKARADRPDSDIVVVVDLDHLPIIADLKTQKLAHVRDWMTTYKQTPAQAADKFGEDIEETDATAKVWVQSTEVPFDPEEVIPEPVQTPPDATSEPQDDDFGSDGAQDAPVDEDAQKAARGLRGLYLAKLEEGRCFRLHEADLLNTSKNKRLREQIRLDYAAIKPLAGSPDAKASVKRYLNKAHDRHFMRGLTL